MAGMRQNNGEEVRFDAVFKMLVIGDSNVGKTTLLTRFCEDRYQSNFMSTVGIDYKTKIITLDDERVKLQIWDTAGQERFRTLTNAYFRGAAGALLLYDITSRTSFVNVSGWMDSVSQHASNNICIMLIGHKSDAENEREVTTVEGETIANHYGCKFFEASAKNGHNVSSVFIRLAQDIKSNQEIATYQKTGKKFNSLTNDGQLNVPNDSPRKNSCTC